MAKKKKCRYELQGIFPCRYVIELGNGQFFQKWRKKRIRCVPFHRARLFPGEDSAETYIRKHFGYYGMETYICRLCWVLVSWDSQENARYWDGNGFTEDLCDAIMFPDYETAAVYQREHDLCWDAYEEIIAYRTQKICPAA